ncbi:MAG: NAD(P)H-hydrate dehydratase [Betaproteobacteria bacterium]
MAWAGRRVARWALSQAPHAQRVWVAAGPGGNGVDGLHAARHLAELGRQVVITLHAAHREPRPDTDAVLRLAVDAGCQLVQQPPQDWADLVIDALLGLGAHRPLDASIAAAVKEINDQPSPCMSIDLPTGLNADTGQLLGGDWIRAQATLSLLTLKPGLFMGHGRDAAGKIWFDPLDNTPLGRSVEPTAVTVGLAPCVQPSQGRAHASHKGRFGDVIVLGGAAGMTGALRLAAHAALAAGAGRVIAVPLDAATALGDATRPECMWMRPEGLADYPLERATVVCGCGGSTSISAWLPAVLQRAGRLVLDADALNVVAQQPALQRALQERRRTGQASVITPHPLEAARLLDCAVQDIQADRLGAARRLSDRCLATAVLKGSGTVIASPGELPEINITGNGALATGGTGDVLAGWLAGRWSSAAQMIPQVRPGTDAASSHPLDRESLRAHRVACEAVRVHGQAADLHGTANALRAADLVERMRSLVS